MITQLQAIHQKNIKLTARKAKWVSARQNSGVAIVGLPLLYNAAAAIKYRAKLNLLISRMDAITIKALSSLFKSDHAKQFYAMDVTLSGQAKILTNKLNQQFTDLFNSSAITIATQTINSTEKLSATALQASLKQLSGGLILKTDYLSGDMLQIFNACINENVSLIKSIPAQYMQRVDGAVTRSITLGNGLQDLIPQLESFVEITKRRAKNIALDQTRKSYNAFNAERMRKNNINDYVWVHSGGGQHPREDHIQMDGKTYSLNPPRAGEEDRRAIIDKRTGERGIPGQAPNCRCTMIPKVSFGKK